MIKVRVCDSPAPANGGRNCNDENELDSQIQLCSKGACSKGNKDVRKNM